VAKLLNEKTEAEDENIVSLDDGLKTEQAEESKPVVSEYSSKSREDLEAMLEDQKKMIGRQSGEVGKARAEIEALKSADAFIQGQLSKNSVPEQPKEEIDYFSDPAGAISKSVADNPELQSIKAELSQLKMNNIKSSLEASHPDYMDILGNQDFNNWVNESPTRRASFGIMDRNFDLEIANDLLSGFKQFTQTEVKQEDVIKRKNSVKAASSGNVSSSSESSPGKKIRASDLRDLQIKDPKKYSQMQDEIVKAFREGRVLMNS